MPIRENYVLNLHMLRTSLLHKALNTEKFPILWKIQRHIKD